MNKGERVIYTGDSSGLKATIVDTSYSMYYPAIMVTIEFDDENLLPRQMDVALEYVKKIELYNQVNINCCCGVKFIRDGGRHSSWCFVGND